MTRLTRIALDRPSITVLVMLLLLVAGIAAAYSLNQELIPDIDFPQASVVAVWPGASADQVTQQVVKPIEKALEQLNGIPVVEVSSRASESFGAVTVRAEFGTTQDELRDAITLTLADLSLPEEVGEPEIVLFNFSDLPVVQASASGDLELAQLQQLIEDEVVPELEAIDGVSRVTVAGGRVDRIFVTIDPDKMAEAGVSLDSISGVLKANNLSFPAGTLLADGQSIPLQVGHRLRTVEDLRQLNLRGGAPAGFGPPGSAAGPPDSPAADQAAAEEPMVGSAAVTAEPQAVAAAPEAAAAATISGPFPLPALLQARGYETTDDLTPELVRDLADNDPELLQTVGREIIDTLPPGSLPALPTDVVSALPEDLRTLLVDRTGVPTPAAAVAEPPAAAPAVRLRAVIVGSGDTLSSIADRFGTDPEAIRQANGLVGDDIALGALLRVPLPSDGDNLPPAWAAYGATRAGDVTAAILDQAIAETPGAVSDLTADQLLALPPETIAALPEALVARQSADVEAALFARVLGDEAVPAAAATLEPTATPLPAPTAAATDSPEPPAAAGPATEPGAAPTPLTLGDIATIERAPEELTSINRTDLEPSLSLLVVKDQSANTVTVANHVTDRLDELADEPALRAVTFNTLFEQASFIEGSLSGVVREGLLGAVFAVLVILVFLSFSVRSTLVTAISIPLSVFTGFLLMRAQGLTLNLLTLSGMTVAIGRVVDDAIVVLENGYRHIQRGERRIEAVIEGTREVATAITASTLVTVAVFLPLGLIGGLTTQFFLPFGLTVSYALLASLLVAVTIVPVLARIFLSRGSLPEERETWLQRLYTPSLEWALDHRLLTLFLAFVFFAASLGLVRFIPQTFLPSFGEPSINVQLALDPGSSLAITDEVARRVETILMDDADIDIVQATVGSSGGAESFFLGSVGGNTARATFFATLVDDHEDEPDAIADRLRNQLEGLDVGRPVTVTVSAGGLGGPASGVYDLQIRSADEAALRDANARVLASLLDKGNWSDYDKPPIINLASNLSEARNVLAVDVDPARALERGLSAAQVGLALRQVLEGQDLGDVEIEDVDNPGEGVVLTVQARFPEETIGSVEALNDYKITAPDGSSVRLDEVATVQERPGPVVITRVDGERAALISGELIDDDTFGVIADADQIIADLELDEDVVDIGAGVETSQQQEGFRDTLVALPISIAVVYLIMALTFGSLVHPFTILFSLPFAASGALVALAVTGRPLSISSLIGLLMLVGIVVTNAIVLVDLVQQYRGRGMTAREALVRGGRTRLRPILMTAVATIFALFPMALGFTEGAIIAAELATVVIGGLATATLLTLIVVPVIYSLLDGLSGGDRGGVPPAAPVAAGPLPSSSSPAGPPQPGSFPAEPFRPVSAPPGTVPPGPTTPNAPPSPPQR